MTTTLRTAATLSFVVCLACRPQPGPQWPETGTDLYAVAQDSVREVLISSPSHKIYAYRWAADRPFQLVIASKEGHTAEQCASGTGFDRLFRALATVPVVGESKEHFETGTADWTDVRLRDTTELEPIEARIRIPVGKDEPAVIQFGDRQYVVGVNAAALQMAKLGCAELGRRD